MYHAEPVSMVRQPYVVTWMVKELHSMQQFFLRTSIVLMFALSVNGCLFKAFHPTIRQGNVMTDAQMDAIKPGMSIKKVQKMLGEPVLTNIYPDNEVAYVWTVQIKGSTVHKRHMVLMVRNGVVVSKHTSEHWPTLPRP